MTFVTFSSDCFIISGYLDTWCMTFLSTVVGSLLSTRSLDVGQPPLAWSSSICSWTFLFTSFAFHVSSTCGQWTHSSKLSPYTCFHSFSDSLFPIASDLSHFASSYLLSVFTFYCLVLIPASRMDATEISELFNFIIVL